MSAPACEGRLAVLFTELRDRDATLAVRYERARRAVARATLSDTPGARRECAEAERALLRALLDHVRPPVATVGPFGAALVDGITDNPTRGRV